MEQHDSIILILGLGVLLSFSIHGLPELELKERLDRLHPLDRQYAFAAVQVELAHPCNDVLLEGLSNFAEQKLVVVVEDLRHALDEDHLDVGHDDLHSLPGYLGRRGVRELGDDGVRVYHCERCARER